MKKCNFFLRYVCIIPLLVVITIFFPQIGSCQDAYSVPLPDVLPPSPSSAALGKFGQFPVNYSVGKPEISIPLFTVQGKNISLPLSLSYDAGGIRVDERASNVGLGWVLNAGGRITRTINGLPDEEAFGSLNVPVPTVHDLAVDAGNNDGHSYLAESLVNNIQDASADFFFYNFANYSGKFIIRRNGVIKSIPDNMLSIQPNIVNHLLLSFTVIDDAGVHYYFEAKTSTQTITTTRFKDSYSYYTSWMLTKVVNANKSDSISLNYVPDAVVRDTADFFSESIGKYSVNGQSSLVQRHQQLELTRNILHFDNLRLESIVFANGKLVFNSKSRDDLEESAIDKIDIYNKNALTDGLRKIQSLQFYQSYFLSKDINTSHNFRNSRRLKLDSLSFIGEQGEIKRYSFGYNSTALPDIHGYAQDYWGYYNNANGNVNLIPHYEMVSYGSPGGPWYVGGADRDASGEYAMASILEKIVYPTGGMTSFKFESNRFLKSTITTTTTDHSVTSAALGQNSTQLQTAYNDFTFNSEVSLPASLTIFLSSFDDEYYTYQQYPQAGITDLTNGAHQELINSGDPAKSKSGTLTFTLTPGHTYRVYASSYGSSVTRASVVCTYSEQNTVNANEIADGGGIRLKSKTTYSSDHVIADSITYAYKGENGEDYGLLLTPYSLISHPSNEVHYFTINDPVGEDFYRLYFNAAPYFPLTTFSGSPLTYKTVEETFFNNGKIIRDYDIQTDDIIPLQTWFNCPWYLINNDWKSGLLLNERKYKYANNVFGLVQETKNEYLTEDAIADSCIKVYEQIRYLGANSPYFINYFGYFDMPIKTGVKRLSKQVVKAYDENSNASVETERRLYYGSNHLYPIREVLVKDPLGDSVINVYKYPQDKSLIVNPLLSGEAIPAVDSLIAKHILNPKIDEVKYRNNMQVEAERINYRRWTPQLVAPENHFHSINGNPIEVRLQYKAYDQYGNVTEVAKDHDVSTSYTWDYNGMYPTASVVNAATSEIAYTSFESNTIAKWIVGSTLRDSTSSVTGKYAYRVNNDISISVSSQQAYMVTYWTKNNNAFFIQGTIQGYPLKGRTINGWTLYVHKVTGQSTLIVSGNGLIDELRLYPDGAQMSTYTYTPLVGTISQFDIGSRATYYEYDGLQRLKRVRDQDSNILKSYEYQYQAPGGCGPNCYSIAMQSFAGNATRGYPVGVFSIEGKLLGNASNASEYVNKWNGDATNAATGTLSTGSDPLHFNLTLYSGKVLPAGVTGCRYYQVDLPWTDIDGVRNKNAVYIDFGDGTGMKMGAGLADIPSIIAPNTIYKTQIEGNLDGFARQAYFKHTYPDTSLKTLTFYHNDDMEFPDFDNVFGDAYGLSKLRNLRGNLPFNTPQVGGSSYQESSMSSIAQITNWNNIHGVTNFRINNGDALHPWLNISFPQDFLAGNPNLAYILTVRSSRYPGFYDPNFKLSRLKSDWNTYFTKIHYIRIHDDHWNHEDLSALKKLAQFTLYANTQDHMGSLSPTGSPWVPISSTVIDNILKQIAAGAGQSVTNGVILINSAGGNRSPDSDGAVQFLLSKGWSITINTDAIPPA